MSWKRLLLTILVLLAVAAVLGPRPSVDATIYPMDLPTSPAGVAEAVSDREAALGDVGEGMEKRVVLVDDAPTPLSVVYIHGFSASRQELEPVVARVADELGANRFYTRLTGHGRTASAMGDVTVNDWINDGAEAMSVGVRLGERVVLVGTSHGGALATWLANQPLYRDRIAALVLISPNYGPADPASRVLLWPWGGLIARVVQGPERCWEPVNELQAQYWTECYPTRALLPMMGLVDLVQSLDLGEQQVPTLLFYSPGDQVVDPRRIVAGFEEMGSPRKVLVEVEGSTDPSQHVLAGDILSPGTNDQMVRAILEFVRGG